MSPPLSLSVYPPNNYNGLFVVEPTYYTGLSKSRKDSTAFIYLETENGHMSGKQGSGNLEKVVSTFSPAPEEWREYCNGSQQPLGLDNARTRHFHLLPVKKEK